MIIDREIRVIKTPFESETILLAVNELEKYSTSMFGENDETVRATFSIDEKLNSFEVKSCDNNLEFIGKNEFELLYSVYDFCEKILGYLFMEVGRDMPPKSCDAIKLEDNCVIIADKEYALKRRGFIQEFPFAPNSLELFDWMGKRRMNYLMTWMKYYDLLSDDMKNYATIRGVEFESGHHNFNYWIPASKYLENHHDFFAEINGKRITPNQTGETLLVSEQLCTTNKELRREIVKNMVDYCVKHPEVKTLSLIPNDGFGWCECSECSKFYDKNSRGELYNVSEHVYKADKIYHDLIADVASQLKLQKADLNLTFCAYVNYSAPAENFELLEGITVHFAPYWRCINHKLNDPACPINSKYIEDLERWRSAKKGGEINIYEYYMGVNLYVSLPMIHFREMFDEIQYYNEKSIDGLLTQFSVEHWRVYGLNYYFMSKAGCGEDFETSYNEVFEKLYGNQADKTKEFYKLLKKMVLDLGSCHIPYPYSLFSRLDEKTLYQAYDLAKELAENLQVKYCQDLVVWCEYMVKFYELFKKYHNGELAISEIEDFRSWIMSKKDCRIFLVEKVNLLLNAWIFAIENSKDWLHFNLDWEDNYIRKHRDNK